MHLSQLKPETHETLQHLLGYLNFSSGAPDTQFLAGLNDLFEKVHDFLETAEDRSKRRPRNQPAAWRVAVAAMINKLDELKKDSPTFGDSEQAERVLRLLQDRLVTEYFAHHCDQLFHQSEETIVGSLMLGRACQTLLAQDLSQSDDVVIQGAIKQLNDFVGHRPVATLESRDIEARVHEWIRPVPVYVSGAGCAPGPYQLLIEPTLELLRQTDPAVLRAAYFELEALDELAFDPRAYDFDHPVNRRPNYHFGEWDPHQIDNRGRFTRFVVRQVTLEALVTRIQEEQQSNNEHLEEIIFECSAVLAGTILMASGISGNGPAAHDSHTSLITLVPQIAAYRDAFYEQLLGSMEGQHAERLQQERNTLQQPFGAARQHLNLYLAQLRASQLQHVKLAKVFAKMGYPGAAQRQSDAVPVTSTRMQCRIDCAVAAGHLAIANHNREAAVKNLDRIIEQLKRGIECGAIVDPWNILGFQANFSLFPAMENTVRDHRIDELVALVDRTIDLYSRLWSDAAAADDQATCRQVEASFEELAIWWNQFAAHEVPSVKSPNPMDEFKAARLVAKALNEWYRSGAETGNIGFWAPHVESFDTPKAYSLVIETLLGKKDFTSAMSLLVHWLNQAPAVPLEDRERSFHALAQKWVHEVVNQGLSTGGETSTETEPPAERASAAAKPTPWKLLRKFFDYLEANADDYWQVPKFRLHEQENDDGTTDEEDSDDPFQAAYEGVVFRDSTDDGIDGAIFETPPTTDSEIESESERIIDRISFLGGLAKLWSNAAVAIGLCAHNDAGLIDEEAMRSSLLDWHHRCMSTRRGLLKLVDVISEEKLYRQGGDHDAMLEYDRRRLMKESLIEQIIATYVDTSEAERFLIAALLIVDSESATLERLQTDAQDKAERQLIDAARIHSAILKQDREATGPLCASLLEALASERILYVPLSKSGVPREIAVARMRQRMIENLLVALPRMGMLHDTLRLMDTAREMERNIPAGRGAVTQFDELFEVGFREMVLGLVRATAPQAGFSGDEDRDAESLLVHYLEQLTESALECWLKHSRTLRLSVLERVRQPTEWHKLVAFIEKYGGDLFTQKFLMLGNVRAILHCGSENWLADEARSAEDPPLQIVEALSGELSQVEAADRLNLILEAIVENYHEYRDYNSTTTQSDRGDMLYTMLDFVRVRVAYDRVAWNLRPVVLAHEVLVRNGRNEAAQLWRRMLADRIGAEADRYQRELEMLQEQYAMRMASVAERLNERFLVPMTIDRMRALVKPAVDQVGQAGPHHSFEILEEETALLMREPTGSGVEAPSWLLALEQEVEILEHRRQGRSRGDTEHPLLEPVILTSDQIEEQLILLQGKDEEAE